MANKKLEVVELNKKEEQITIEEYTSKRSPFWKKYGRIIFLITLIISLTTLIVSVFMLIKNLSVIEEPKITKTDVPVDFRFGSDDISLSTFYPITDEAAINSFHNSKAFKSNGEVLLVRISEASTYTIRYYSDGTALKIMTQGNTITRIAALEDGSYAINDSGIVADNAIISDITVTNTRTFAWGTVTYYSDGSAEVTNSRIDMYVRNSDDIKENFISNNKVSYFKEQENVGSIKINYYYDGTTEVIKSGTSYIIRNASDMNKTSSDVIFPNNNTATISNTITLADGKIIKYYSDGSAIIYDGSRTISVRKSNSIVIQNNKIKEIVDSDYVTVAGTKNGVTYYTNGGSITDYNGKTYYVGENSNIKFTNNAVSNIGTSHEEKSSFKVYADTRVTIFENLALVETSTYKKIISKDKITYDTDGNLKEILSDTLEYEDNPFTVTNNTDDDINYRIVIEKSDRTNLDVSYIKYQLSTSSTYIKPTLLNSNIWQSDALATNLSASGTNYILISSTLEAHESTEVRLMLWTDYTTIPNTMQNKYFYGTIRIYAWVEE